MYIRQLKVEQKLPSAASQLALEGQVKLEVEAEARAKAKIMNSPKIPMTKAAAAWSQSSGGPHSKPRVVEEKEGAQLKRPQ
ncbi:hypothetical protein N302_05624, partial [Corvus brachyrhynchos]